ncbi:hypothetical protein ALC56_06006, partial [Trachymyrmex septentrionalis]
EEIAMNKLLVQPLFYFRYIDVILALLSNIINDILNTFNSLHTRLQFIIEAGTDNRLSFLDTMLIIDNHRIIFDTYYKKTFSGRFVNFHSNHPLLLLTDHHINFDHNFRWNEVKILDSESLYNKKLVSEMVHIKRQKQGLNKQNETESLPESYL